MEKRKGCHHDNLNLLLTLNLNTMKNFLQSYFFGIDIPTVTVENSFILRTFNVRFSLCNQIARDKLVLAAFYLLFATFWPGN